MKAGDRQAHSTGGDPAEGGGKLDDEEDQWDEVDAKMEKELEDHVASL